jgi:hypothetical protein
LRSAGERECGARWDGALVGIDTSTSQGGCH